MIELNELHRTLGQQDMRCELTCSLISITIMVATRRRDFNRECKASLIPEMVDVPSKEEQIFFVVDGVELVCVANVSLHSIGGVPLSSRQRHKVGALSGITMPRQAASFIPDGSSNLLLRRASRWNRWDFESRPWKGKVTMGESPMIEGWVDRILVCQRKPSESALESASRN